VVGVEVIAKLGVIDEFSGEQAFDALATALRGTARPVLGLAGELCADRGDQAIAERCLCGEQSAKDRTRNVGPLRLFDEEVPKEGVAGEVATQDGVEGNAVARIQTSLREQDGRNGRWVALTRFEDGKTMIDSGSEGSIEALQVCRVGDIVRV
jgi:hypothetical protein